MRTALLTALLIAPLTLSAQTAEPAVRISLNENGEFESGDRARVHVQTAADGYLVVLRTDPDGWIRVLYPTDPFHDNFVRGGREFEVRGRGDREAFQASWRGGSGVVFAAYSTQPFDFGAFTRNDHWDYRVLDTLKSRSDPEAALLAVVDQMVASGTVEYDVLTYNVSGNRSGNGYYTTYRSSYYYYPSWYYPYYSSYYYDSYWYRPYYRSYYSCYFCYPRYGWSVSFGWGYRPWWGYRSPYYGHYAGYWGYSRSWRPYYSSYAYGYSYRSWNRYAFDDWSGRGYWNSRVTDDGGFRNARTGEVAVRSRYTQDLVDRRRREVTSTMPVAQASVQRRAVAGVGAGATTQARSAETATVTRRVIAESGNSGSGVSGRREIVGGDRSATVLRQSVSGDRSVTMRRGVTPGGSAGGDATTIRRVDVPERHAAESRGVSSSGRSYNGGRPVDYGPGRTVSRDRPSVGGGEGRRSPDSYSSGGRVSSGGGRSVNPSRGSSSSGGGRVSGSEGRRSPGGYSAPSRGSSGGGGGRSAPSSGGGGRRRPG